MTKNIFAAEKYMHKLITGEFTKVTKFIKFTKFTRKIKVNCSF